MSEFILSDFEKECLQEHNRLRALHNTPPMKLSRVLCNFAEEWAKILLKKNKMEHRENNAYGENVYMAIGKKIDGALPVKQWYNEIKNYDYKKGTFRPETGHFTQVVWKETTELGVGVAIKGKTTFVVCNYNPPGNIVDYFTENVLPLKK